MSPLTFTVGKSIGIGGYAMIFGAEECSLAGISAAIKKSRVSLRVKRTILRHEARVLQLLQGHSAIPMLFGYQRLPHFEYIAIDLLGQNLKELCKAGQPLKIGTVACIADQMLSALEHLNAHSIVHRDIKPENILLRLSDTSRVCLIDFGMARQLLAADATPKHRYNPIKSNRTVVGTLHWCSINAHLGFDLRPYDDLESLAYTLLYLLMGNLPWRISRRIFDQYELMKTAMLRILAAKMAFTIPAAVPFEFHDLLDFARNAKGDITDDLAEIRLKIRDLISNIDETQNKPLEITLEEAVFAPKLVESRASSDSDSDVGSDEEEFSNSYRGMDLDCWDTHSRRDKSLTFDQVEAELLDGQIPDITVIDYDHRFRPKTA